MHVSRRGRRCGEFAHGVLGGAAAVGLLAALLLPLGGCSRGGAFEQVGHTTSGRQDIAVLAPSGHLGRGSNKVQLRLMHDGIQPLDVVTHLEFVLAERGAAPLRVPVELSRSGPGVQDGTAALDEPGAWWAEVTFDGLDGTETVRVRVTVDR